MQAGERRLGAIMFTDMVGYTALTQSDESRAMEVLERHNRLLRPFFPKFRGREVKAIGDSFLVEFESALDATKCAAELQSFLHDYNISSRDAWKITLRIGVHLGDVIHQGGDVFGDAVNIASRIEPLAEPEGICVSEEVYAQVHNKVDQDLISLGERSLKNVDAPVTVYRVEMPWERSASPVVLDRLRVAVLPFVSISPDPSDEYFADGLTEELIGRLSLVRGLEVIARTSVMNYKRKEATASQIGTNLKAGTLLEGSVRKSGNRIRVTAQLIDANTEGHLWMENYDRSLEDIFAVQSEVAERVAGSLEVKLTTQDRKMMGRGNARNPEAYTLYLKGQVLIAKWERDPLMSAVKLFEQALSIDSAFTLAYCGLAKAYQKLGFQDHIPPREAYGKAWGYARKALELDPSLADAHLVLSQALQNDFDLKGAMREIEKAIELDPNMAEAYGHMAALDAYSLNFDESLKYVRKRLELDPVSVESLGEGGTWFLYAGHYDEAIKHLRAVMELDPGNSFYLDNLGLAYVKKGMVEEGLAMVRRAAEISKTPATYSDLGYALVKAGRIDEARGLLSKLLENVEGRIVPPTAIAGLYAILGEKDRALDWLERAYDERSGYLLAVAGDFIFESLLGDKRYVALLGKMGIKAPT